MLCLFPQFGDSQVIPKAKLPQLIQAVISSLASPDSETLPNNLVLVTHGASGDLARLDDMKIKIPHNMLVIDTATFERRLYNEGRRPLMIDPKTSKERQAGSTLSLENLLRSFAAGSQKDSIVLPNIKYHNAGNDAFMCLFALQMLIGPKGVRVPTPKRTNYVRSGVATVPNALMVPDLRIPMTFNAGYATFGGLPTPNGLTPGNRSSVYDLASEFGQMRMGIDSSGSKLPGKGGSVRMSRRPSGLNDYGF
eukprot:GHVO01030161.1.p1 GENE.GHVO01030161.1~~GHVO01030161.1.p1  ORF type:complete len:251 (+),score=16.81 GHVO01030161.1:613-1365(+)